MSYIICSLEHEVKKLKQLSQPLHLTTPPMDVDDATEERRNGSEAGLGKRGWTSAQRGAQERVRERKSEEKEIE